MIDLLINLYIELEKNDAPRLALYNFFLLALFFRHLLWPVLIYSALTMVDGPILGSPTIPAFNHILKIKGNFVHYCLIILGYIAGIAL